MKTMTKYILLLLILFITNNSLGQSDAKFNKLIHEYTLNDDGSSLYREYKEVKLLSHMAFHRLYGETFVIYNPLYQELKINTAYTIMRDGKRVDVPANAFNEVLPREASNAAPYNHLREMVITHTGLEVGATIYLDYTIMTKAGYMPAFMGEEFIRDIVPIKEKLIIINIPAGEELRYKMLNLRTAPQITEQEGLKTYAFTFRELSPYQSAWGVDYELMPRLFFSTARDLERAYFPFVAQEAFTYQATPDMTEAAQKLKDENGDALKTALAIQKMILNETGTWNLSLAHTGFSCRSPREVWQSNAGTILEKTVLLATLLQKAGLEAVPVAIIPEKYYDQSVGSLYIFKDFAVQVKVDVNYTYLSAGHTHEQDLAYDFSGKKLLILDGAIESLRAFNREIKPAGIIYQVEGRLDDSLNIEGEVEITLNEGANPYFNLFLDTTYAKRYFAGAKEAELIALEKSRSHFRLKIKNSGAVKEYGEYLFLGLPSSPQGISSWGLNYIERDRKEAIKLKDLIDEQYHFTLSLPEGYKIVSQAVEHSVDNEIGYLKISLKQEGNVVHAVREIRIHRKLITPAEFDAFNKVWEGWMNPSMIEIIIRKQL